MFADTFEMLINENGKSISDFKYFNVLMHCTIYKCIYNYTYTYSNGRRHRLEPRLVQMFIFLQFTNKILVRGGVYPNVIA